MACSFVRSPLRDVYFSWSIDIPTSARKHRPPRRAMRSTRRGKTELTLIDGIIFVVVAGIVAATTMPVLETLNHRAKVSSTMQSLHTLRSQIELYKLEHGGQPPLLYEGDLPQLDHATNARGVPGPAGDAYPFGPYLKAGVPINPLTGGYLVTAVEAFPPKHASGNGGWLYHPPTGRIAPDVEGYLDR